MVTLTELFAVKQQEMQAMFSANLSHPVAQGNNTESIWLQFFRAYLPSRYACDSGFVIDCNGNISDQIDLIVYDRYFSPFLFNREPNKYIPAESVYAVFEIKPILNKANFDYAGSKISSVRKLHRTSAKVLCNGKLCPGRIPFPIIGGLLTISSQWGSQLPKQAINPNSDNFLDLGCCVNDYSWIAKNEPETNEYKYVSNTNRDESLLAFFMTFLAALQERGTAPAIEIPKYFNGFN